MKDCVEVPAQHQQISTLAKKEKKIRYVPKTQMLVITSERKQLENEAWMPLNVTYMDYLSNGKLSVQVGGRVFVYEGELAKEIWEYMTKGM